MKIKKPVLKIVSLFLCATMIFSADIPAFSIGALAQTTDDAVVEQWTWDESEADITGDDESGYTITITDDYSRKEPLKKETISQSLPQTITAQVLKSDDAQAQSEAESTTAQQESATAEQQESTTAQPQEEVTQNAETTTQINADGSIDEQTLAALEQSGDQQVTVSEDGTVTTVDDETQQSDNPLQEQEVEVETLDLTWDLGDIPKRGIYKDGSYTATASLPKGYTLASDAPQLEVTMVAAAAATPSISDEVLKKNQLKTTTPVNTKVNLFDYWVYGGQTTNDWINQEGLTPKYSSHTAGINKGHPILIANGMGHYYDNGAHSYRYGLWNTTAKSWNASHVSKNYSYIENIVERRLGSDGMPQINTAGAENRRNLTQEVYDAWDKDPSLGYLFDPSKEVEGRAVYKNVRNLFTLGGGNYHFSSNTNFAQFIESDNVIGSDGYFNVYNTWAVLNGSHSNTGNFAPFNNVYQVFKEDKENGVLKDSGLGNRAAYYNVNATSDGTTANTTTINHYLGMTMDTSFMQPDGGVIKGGGSDKGEPMTFKFSGDNDVWVFIDDVLVGDLGGVHSESFIVIDFSTGYIYRGSVKKTGEIPSITELEELFKSKGESEGLETIVLSTTTEPGVNYFQPNTSANVVLTRTTLKAMHEAAGDTSQVWNGKTYDDQTIHTLKFYYLERGGWDTNLTLDFNLVSVPHSMITKVDQDGQPVSGASFELYAADYDEATGKTIIREYYNDGKPICTGTTNDNGMLILSDERRRIVQFDELAQRGVTSYLLREIKVPIGFRSRGDVTLYYENGLVFSRDYMHTGVYTTGMLNVTMDKTLYDRDDTDKILVQDTNDMKGVIFAVPLKLDSAYEGTFYRDDPTLQSRLHPVTGSFYTGWKVMAEGADFKHSQEDKAAIVAVAVEYNNVAEKNNRDVYAMTIDSIPGVVQKQYWYTYTLGLSKGLTGDELNKFVADRVGYEIGFYYAPDITSLDNLTVNDDIYRISDANFEKEFSSNMHVPNTFNRFRVQKLNYHGDTIEGATFALYNLYCEHDRDGDGDVYLPISIFGEVFYINTQMFNLSAQDLADIKAGAASGNYVNVTTTGSDGVPIVKKKKTYAELKADWDGGKSITPWDWTTTRAQSNLGNLALHGAAMFPSAYEGLQIGHKDPYNINNTRTYLEIGYYVLCEVEAPVNHVYNETLVPVEIHPDSVYADAGTAGDGVRVGKYIGFPVSSMTQFAAEDAIDGTLTYLQAHLKIVNNHPLTGGTVDTSDTDIVEGDLTYHYKYDNTLGYYQRMLEEDNTTVYMKDASNLYMFTGEGHPVLRAYQETEQKRYTICFKNDYVSPAGSTNKNGKLLLDIEDENGNGSRLIVNVSDGMAVYRLKNGSKVTKYSFAQFKPDGKSYEGLYELNQEDPNSAVLGDFVLNVPDIQNAGGTDISNLYSVSTLVQVYDQDQGDVTFKVKVEPDHVNEDKPFYFRLYAVYQNITEVTLFDPKTRKVASNYNGVLNVRIGAKGDGTGVTTEYGDYNESETRTLSVEFKNGIGKMLLTENQEVKVVEIPENPDNPACGLLPFIPYQIKLSGDMANYTGSLYVSAKSNTSDEKKKTQRISFTNGVATYYAANASEITAVSTAVDRSGYGPAGTQYDFEASSHFATAKPSEIFDEAPLRKINVEYDTSESAYKDIITSDNTNMVDVTQEDGKYYMQIGDVPGSDPFLGDKGVVADFALYRDQSITIHNIPCGITYYIQEWSLDESPPGTQYDNTNTAYQNLTEKYITTTTTTTETGAPTTGNQPAPESQFDYQETHRTAQSIIRSDVTRTIVFHNRMLLGSLVIQKEVDGNMGEKERLFDFTVTFDDKTLNAELGGVQITNGVAHVKLKHGERVAIPELPKDVGYTVTETAVDGYTTTYTQTKHDQEGNLTETLAQDAQYTAAGVTGTVDSEAQNRVVFRNYKDVIPDTGVWLEALLYILIIVIALSIALWIVYSRRRKRKRKETGGDDL